jgi:translation initiation factor IF-2
MGRKCTSSEISAKFGNNVDLLLEKVFYRQMLELKANPNKVANGVVIEASLDKGRGYVSTVLVQGGTLKVGDYLLAGKNHKVKQC